MQVPRVFPLCAARTVEFGRKGCGREGRCLLRWQAGADASKPQHGLGPRVSSRAGFLHQRVAAQTQS